MMVSNKENLKSISNLKIDTEGHEPEVLFPILDLLEQGFVEKMFAECFGLEHDAEFFTKEVGPRMRLLSPNELTDCNGKIVNLKYERYSRAGSIWKGLQTVYKFTQPRRRLTWWNEPTFSTTESTLRYYHHSSAPWTTTDLIKWTEEMRQLQTAREARVAHIKVIELQRTVLITHHDPYQDIHVSGAVSRGQLFEQPSVVALSNHFEMILNQFNVQKSAKDVAFIDIGANIGMYTVALGARFLDLFPSVSIFAFEPSSENLALLSSSLRQNRLSNVYLYPYGLAESGNLGDTVSFVVDAVNKGHNHVAGDHSWSEVDSHIVDIETVPLDAFSNILKERHPDLYRSWSNVLWLKMDTEGLEPFIILGGRQSLFSNSKMDPCFVKLEFMKHKKEIVDLLMDAGYQMVSQFNWASVAQPHRFTRTQAANRPDLDAIFAKRDVERCVRNKMQV